MNMYFETFVDESGKDRWRLKAKNGEIVADSGQGYVNYGDMVETINKIKAGAPHAKIQKADG
jgi:uncharacterized protein YegP (UPF0339 family)